MHMLVSTEIPLCVSQHMLSLEAFEQATTYKGAKDAAVQGGLGTGHRFGGYAGNPVKIDAGRNNFGAGALLTHLTCHRLQHAIARADMEVHMRIQNGREPRRRRPSR